jgi:glucose/arabinose dehydrogenase
MSTSWTAAALFGVMAGSGLAQPVGDFQLWSRATPWVVQLVPMPGDPTLMIGADRTGKLWAVESSTGARRLAGTASGVVLDITARTLAQGDGGFLSVAYAPDFAASRKVYVYYNRRPDFAGVVSRFTVPAGGIAVDPNSEEVLLVTPRPAGHNGGWMGFSPTNGLLHLALGDGGTSGDPDPLNRAQTITGLEFSGKVLRIDVSGGDDFPADPNRNYTIPSGNPFVGLPGDDEIFAYGLRNPWRCAFDALTGDLWIGDVGQDLWEEIILEPDGSAGGKNYGWRCMEHTHCTGLSGCVCGDPGLASALHAYGHDLGCSISPGYVYRGAAFPMLVGAYLFTDWCSGRVWALRQEGGVVQSVEDWTDRLRGAGPGLVNAVVISEDAFGEPLIVEYQSWRVYRVMPRCRADFNGDSFLDFFDYDDFVRCFEVSECPTDGSADFNLDGFVDFFDYDGFVTAFETGC